jgi:TRAP-type C4-dicarboxylate transport system substrate-binding protein
MGGNGIRMAVAAGAALAVATGAAGEVHAKQQTPIVLTMTVADTGGPPSPAIAFDNAVARLSKGAVQVVLRIPQQQTADGELRVIGEVERGESPLGWVPTRAWDAVGLQTFAAIQAPFLLTNYALLKKVLAGPIGHGMLAGTRPAGVRTLGLAAVDEHVPLGARQPFRSPADFAGATLRVPSNSRLTSATLEALGGKAAAIASGPELFTALKSGAVDGAITSPLYVLRNGYYGAAKYLTTNLVFFPYVGTIAINERAFDALSSSQRSALLNAAAQMTRASFVGLRARDQQQLQLLCATGMKIATSTRAQLTALRRAVASVYADLRSDRATAARIAKIEALKRKTRATPPLRIPSGCAA